MKKIIYVIMFILCVGNTLLSAQNQGYTVRGTVFPFVNIGYPPFDELFAVKAELYAVPAYNVDNPLYEIIWSTPLYKAEAINYDGSIFVPGTPKNSGEIGSADNPGLPIQWNMIGKTIGSIDSTLLTPEDNIPYVPIGLFTFTNVDPGEYILVLSRPGCVTRFGKVSIDGNTELGHRELVVGDVDGNNQVNVFDISIMNAMASFYGDTKYNAKYDLNADGLIDYYDNSLALSNMGFQFTWYKECMDWLNEWNENRTYNLNGTVFPFVSTGDSVYDALFPVTAELYAVPSTSVKDPMNAVLQSSSLYTSEAVNYDGSVFVSGTPKNPGQQGAYNNPGLPISWSSLGKNSGSVDSLLLTREDNIPSSPIGLYSFTNVAPGDYILVLSREGFVTRFTKITVNASKNLGHRELIAGNVNNDSIINIMDVGQVNLRRSIYGDTKYEAKYDLNADQIIGDGDVSLVIGNMGFKSKIYEETKDWLTECEQNRTYTVRGTVFPFVNTGYFPFDEMFEVNAELYTVPSSGATDSLEAILQRTATPLYSNKAENYDGSIFVSGTPKNPGQQGSTDNPGLPVNWSSIGKTQGSVDNTLLTSTDNIPSSPIGLYAFNDVVPGDYILVLSRAGYMTRFAKVTVNNSGVLGHRELLAGDINNDMQVSSTDMSLLNANFSFYGDSKYDTKYDLNADGMVNSADTELLLFYLRATSISAYQDTYDWLMSY